MSNVDGKGKHGGKAVVALDCEMVKCIPDATWLEWTRKQHRGRKDPEYASVAARCAIVDYHGGILYDKFIRPNQKVINYLTSISGVSEAGMVGATPYDLARSEIADILGNKIVVGHDLKQDFNSLQMFFSPDDIRDTSTCELLRERADIPKDRQKPALRDLALPILRREVQTEQPHRPSIDAEIALELYKVVEEEWERSLEVDEGW